MLEWFLLFGLLAFVLGIFVGCSLVWCCCQPCSSPPCPATSLIDCTHFQALKVSYVASMASLLPTGTELAGFTGYKMWSSTSALSNSWRHCQDGSSPLVSSGDDSDWLDVESSLDDIDPLADVPSARPLDSTGGGSASSPTKKAKTSAVLDQLDETEVDLLSRTELDAAFINHIEVTGAGPNLEAEPPPEQIAAIRKTRRLSGEKHHVPISRC